MSEQERRVRGHELHVETATRRREYAVAKGLTQGEIVYWLPAGKEPYRIVGKTDTPVKFLLLVQLQGGTPGRVVDADPFKLTKERPVKARKPGSRH